jgi:hypothetical protein
MRENLTPSTPPELHVCPACASPLLSLVDAAETVPRQWALTLRCPECEFLHEVACTEPDLARLEAELCRGTAALQAQLDRLSREAFAEQVERFIVALRADAVLPMDFGVAR